MWPKLKQAVPHASRMRQPEIRTMLHEQLNQPRIGSKHIYWPSLDVGEDFRVVVLDCKRHRRMLAHLLTTWHVASDTQRRANPCHAAAPQDEGT